MEKQTHDIVFRWLPVIVLCGLIFIQSSFPSPDMGPDFPLKDKLLHLVTYAVLAALMVRGFGLSSHSFAANTGILILSVLLATAYGVSDEWHQSFVAARVADPKDLLADFTGSVFGAVSFFGFWKKYKTRYTFIFLD